MEEKMEARFKECPDCKSKDIEILGEIWICWDCNWDTDATKEEIVEEEKKYARQ